MLKTELHIQATGLSMKWQCLLLIIILPAIWIHTTIASDRTLRCQSHLVSIGVDKSEVLEKCGDPDKITRWEEDYNSYVSLLYDYENDRYQAPKSIKGPILMERWTYNLGSNRFIRYLDFENGRLIRIETGEKGSD